MSKQEEQPAGRNEVRQTLNDVVVALKELTKSQLLLLKQLEFKNDINKYNINKYNNRFNYQTTNYERNRFINRIEIIDLLLKFSVSEDKLRNTTNYKNLLCDILQTTNYYGKMNYLQIMEWITKNNVKISTVDGKVKEGILKLIK
jgi:hypothetical protein